jgi:cysteinyl-tRNA synthetase
MLQVEGKKMSKSLGNFFTVRDLLEQGYPGEVIRFVMLSTHYRSPMDWTAEKARQAEKTLSWLYEAVGDIEFDANWNPNPKVVAALADDLNTSLAITELMRQAETVLPSGHPAADGEHHQAAAELKRTAALLGLLRFSETEWRALQAGGVDLSPYADHLTSLRATAMETKNFAPVDALKSALLAAGVEVRMSKTGVELVPGPDFDPAKLEGLK